MPTDHVIVFALLIAVAAIWLSIRAFRGEQVPSPAEPAWADPIGNLSITAAAVTDATTVKAVLDQVQKSVDRRIAAEGGIDAKITQLFTVVGGGAGIVALVTTKPDALGGMTPLLLVAAVCLLVVLVLSLAALRPRRRSTRSFDDYLDLTFLADSRNEGRFGYEMIAANSYLSAMFSRTTLIKQGYFQSAAGCFILAVLAIFLNFLAVATASPAPSSSASSGSLSPVTSPVPSGTTRAPGPGTLPTPQSAGPSPH